MKLRAFYSYFLFTLFTLISLISSTGFSQFPWLKENPFEGDGFYNLVRAEAGAAVAFLELYPNHEMYFLSRDALRLAHVTKFVAQRLGLEAQNHIHVLDISSVSVKDPNMENYIRQKGISVEALSNGKKILIVDTGFLGSIPDAILETLPQNLHSQVRVHMLECTSYRYPSLNTFGYDVGPIRFILGSGWVADQKFAVGLYSTLPNSHGKAISYENQSRQWIARYKTEGGKSIMDRGDIIDAVKAEQLLRQTYKFLESTEMKEWIQTRKLLWQKTIEINAPLSYRANLEYLEEIIKRDTYSTLHWGNGPRILRNSGDSLPRLSVTPQAYCDILFTHN